MNEVCIGIDFGKNIGLAYSVGSLAVPYCTVQTVQAAADKIIEKRAKLLIIGWPLLLTGQEGEQCAVTKRMLDELLNLCPLPYKLQDERFSSRFSNQGQYQRAKKRGAKCDVKCRTDEKDEHAHSAAWILQSYLQLANVA